MSLSPVLVIGCGGSGGKVVLSLRARLEEDLRRRGWTTGIPDAFQFKWIDVPSPAENHPDFGPPLPHEDYLPLAEFDQFSIYDQRLLQAAGQNNRERLIGWRPSPDIAVPVKLGAGQMRAIGRSVAVTKANDIQLTVERALQKIQSGEAELEQLSSFLHPRSTTGADATVGLRDPLVIVVSSLAGGTGAGIYLDVCDIVRAVKPGLGSRILAILFTPEVFKNLKADAAMAANALAASSELMNAALAIQRRSDPLYGVTGAFANEEHAGPALSYLIGVENLEGRSLESPMECYRAVTETLSVLFLDGGFQQSVLGADIANKTAFQAKRLTHRQIMDSSPGSGLPARSGLIYSFGSAKVSVGSARFAEWARHRLSREVIEHAISGWRLRGLELLDPGRRDNASDGDIVRFLVERDREVFLEACGVPVADRLDEQTPDPVAEGIIRDEQFRNIELRHVEFMVGRCDSQDRTADRWAQHIADDVRLYDGRLSGEIARVLEEGRIAFADALTARIETALSDWIAQFGIPVTIGLVRELQLHCETSRTQLADRAAKVREKQESSNIGAAFQALQSGKCSKDSKYVRAGFWNGMAQSRAASRQRRFEVASELLGDLVDRVIKPVLAELEQVGRDLSHPDFTRMMGDWPIGDGVSPVYQPAPSEFCMVEAHEWGQTYERLLAASAGSAEGARALIGAGGFDHGPIAARVTAERAAQILTSDRSWLGRDARPVKVRIALRPQDVMDRVGAWFDDDSHPMGRFVNTGLLEYLAREEGGSPVPDHLDRLDRFERAISGARQLASPLCRVNHQMMQFLHPSMSDIETDVQVQPLPFSEVSPAGERAARALAGLDQIDGLDFYEKPRVESILLVSRIVHPVHPATVTSLYQPIADRWKNLTNSQNPPQVLHGFWRFNRARLLTESIPLPLPALQTIIRGWYVGRLLGLVTDPTEQRGPQVYHRTNVGDAVSTFVWPALRAGQQNSLHETIHRLEWLPALLENMGIAMMLLSQDRSSIDAYEALFKMGESAESLITAFISEGRNDPRARAQVRGSTLQERQADFVKLVGEMSDGLRKKADLVPPLLQGDYGDFMRIPFGYELYPYFWEQLDSLKMIAGNDLEPARG